jgi:hypothetical protein
MPINTDPATPEQVTRIYRLSKHRHNWDEWEVDNRVQTRYGKKPAELTYLEAMRCLHWLNLTGWV